MQLFILCIYFLYFYPNVSGCHKPIIRGISSCFYIQPFGSCGVYVAHLRVPVDWFVVVVSLYWCRGGFPVLLVVYKKQLEIPLMMGL